MSNNTNVNPILFTPAVTLDWPYLTEPDKGNDKFPKDVPEYQTKFLMADSDAAKAFIKRCEVEAEAIYKKAVEEAQLESRKTGKPARRVKRADLPVYETGEGFSGKAKLKSKGVKRATQKSFEQRPLLVDAAARTWDPTKTIYTGTVAILQVEIVPYDSPALGAGISLRLRGAQILKVPDRQAQQNPFKSQVKEEPEDDEAPIQAFAPQSAPEDNGDF